MVLSLDPSPKTSLAGIEPPKLLGLDRFVPGMWGDKTMADKLIYIPNDDAQNYPVCRLQSMVEMFGHSTLWTNHSNSPKVVKPINNKTLV